MNVSFSSVTIIINNYKLYKKDFMIIYSFDCNIRVIRLLSIFKKFIKIKSNVKLIVIFPSKIVYPYLRFKTKPSPLSARSTCFYMMAAIEGLPI